MSDERSVRFGILHKMLLVMVLVASLPLALVWYTSYTTTKQTITESVDNRLTLTAEGLRGYVDGWVEMNDRLLRQNAELPEITSMDGAAQTPNLKSIVDVYDWNYLAFTVDLTGHNIARSDGKGLKNYGDRSYVRQVFGGKDLGQQVLIGKTSGKPALVLARAIKDTNQTTKGALAIAMTLTDISKQVTAARFGDTGFAFLLDPDGKVIAHPNTDYTSKRADLSGHPGYQALISSNKNATRFIDENGRQVVSHALKTRYGWILVVQQDAEEAFAALKSYNQQSQVLLVVTLVLVLLVALLVSRQLTRPIKRLTEVADAISRGSFDLRVSDTQRGDELGELARAVERLGNSVRLAMDRLKRQKR